VLDQDDQMELTAQLAANRMDIGSDTALRDPRFSSFGR
jgi:hypothetical protein